MERYKADFVVSADYVNLCVKSSTAVGGLAHNVGVGIEYINDLDKLDSMHHTEFQSKHVDKMQVCLNEAETQITGV